MVLPCLALLYCVPFLSFLCICRLLFSAAPL
ncbi:putative membrane protein, partial [Chlamydia ibidis]